MTIIGKIREWVYRPEISQRNQLYCQKLKQEKISEWQLLQFNKVWADIQANVPWYRNKVKRNEIPKTFRNWDEFRNEMPVLTRPMIREHYEELIDERKKPEVIRVTGGTTFEPTKFPMWKEELELRRLDMWVGRSWHGITPSDRCFFLWGIQEREKSQNIFRIAMNNRQLKDRLLGYHRFSAHNVSRERMRQAADELIEFQPAYIVGYSLSVDFMVRENLDRVEEFRTLDLKGIVVSAESFCFSDSEELISSVFNAPVIHEYGTAENCVIAYTDQDGIFNVFWENLMVEGIGSAQPEKMSALITSLYPRCFPLIRYDVGDLIQFSEDHEKTYSLSHFRNLFGRVSDLVEFDDNVFVSSDPFFNAVAGFGDVLAFQIVEADHQVKLLIVCRSVMEESVKMSIKNRLRSFDEVLKDVEVIQVEKLHQTKHGKTPVIFKGKNENLERAQ